jgi:hypothetical protein
MFSASKTYSVYKNREIEESGDPENRVIGSLGHRVIGKARRSDKNLRERYDLKSPRITEESIGESP